MDSPPITVLKFDNFDSNKSVNRIMGRSVIKGANATFNPSFVSCLRVSDITRVCNGPGERPAVAPRTAPVKKYEAIFIMVMKKWIVN